MRVPPETLFYWKLLKIGKRSAKDVRSLRAHPCHAYIACIQGNFTPYRGKWLKALEVVYLSWVQLRQIDSTELHIRTGCTEIHGIIFSTVYFEQGLPMPSVCEFSAFRHYFKTNVAQSVAKLVLYCQKIGNLVIFYQIW